VRSKLTQFRNDIALVIRHPVSLRFLLFLVTCPLLGCRPAGGGTSAKPSAQTTTEAEVEMHTATPAKPARWSLKVNAADMAALQSGAKRLVVIVEAYTPPPGSAGELIVTLAPSDQSKRQELWRIGLHPPTAFDAKVQSGGSKRFLMPIQEFAAFADGEALKLEIAFPPHLAPSSSGSATIRVELVEPKQR
jgi:hypothetical protein